MGHNALGVTKMHYTSLQELGLIWRSIGEGVALPSSGHNAYCWWNLNSENALSTFHSIQDGLLIYMVEF